MLLAAAWQGKERVAQDIMDEVDKKIERMRQEPDRDKVTTQMRSEAWEPTRDAIKVRFQVCVWAWEGVACCACNNLADKLHRFCTVYSFWECCCAPRGSSTAALWPVGALSNAVATGPVLSISPCSGDGAMSRCLPLSDLCLLLQWSMVWPLPLSLIWPPHAHKAASYAA